ncbi:hypothetical protein SK128_018713, partial [Halocaridina rubra]
MSKKAKISVPSESLRPVSRNQLSTVNAEALPLNAQVLLHEYSSSTEVRPFRSPEQALKPSENTVEDTSESGHSVDNGTYKTSSKKNRIFPVDNISGGSQTFQNVTNSDNISGSVSEPHEVHSGSEEQETAEINIHVPVLGDPEGSRRNSLPENFLPSTGRQSRSLSNDDLNRPVSTLGDLRSSSALARSLPILPGAVPSSHRYREYGRGRHFCGNGTLQSLKNAFRRNLICPRPPR